MENQTSVDEMYAVFLVYDDDGSYEREYVLVTEGLGFDPKDIESCIPVETL